MTTVDLIHSVLTLSKDNIIIIRCKDNHIYEVNEIKEIVATTGKLTNGNKVPTLTIPGEYTNASKEALEFIFSEAATEFSAADAFIVNNLAHKLIGNFYLNIKKPRTPTRLFKDQKTAIDWLKSIK